MVNTILTDDEIYGMYSEPSSDAEMVAFAREVEAAVLAKLREQEPVAVVRSNGIEIRGEYSDLIGSNLYAYRVPSDAELYSGEFGFEGCHVFSAANRTNAAPQPAVAQVPQDHTLVPNSALRWLFGEEGEFVCPPSRFFRGAEPRYWWRSVFREMLAAAPQPAVVQVPQDVAHVGQGLVDVWKSRAAPEAPALPADVREALKVAREALGKVDTACRLIPEDLEGYLEPLSDALSDARAAIARLDALGGGE